MGKVEQRQARIIEVLNKTGKVEVTALAKLCAVSLVTIRKDLTELEERGLLKREQGYAVPDTENDMRRRLTSNYSIKLQLAKKAADMITDGDTVMIESGTCCILTAEEISRTKKNVTIVTNSVFMAGYIGKNPNVHIVLLGGDYQADSQAVVGPITKMCAANFHVKYFFAGTDGYRPGMGFTGDNHLRVEALKSFAQNAEKTVIITESEKFGHQGIVPLFTTDDTDYVITDSGLPETIIEELEEHHVNIIKIKE